MKVAGGTARATAPRLASMVEAAIAPDIGIVIGTDIVAGGGVVNVMTQAAGGPAIAIVKIVGLANANAAAPFIRPARTRIRITTTTRTVRMATTQATGTACTPAQTTRVAHRPTIPNARTFTRTVAAVFFRFSAVSVRTNWLIAMVSCVDMKKAFSTGKTTSPATSFTVRWWPSKREAKEDRCSRAVHVAQTPNHKRTLTSGCECRISLNGPGDGRSECAMATDVAARES